MSGAEIDRLLEVIAAEPMRLQQIETELERVDDETSPNLAGLRDAVEQLAAVQKAKLTLAGLPRAELDAGVRRRHNLLSEDPR